MVAVDLPSSSNGVQHAGCQWDGPSPLQCSSEGDLVKKTDE